MHLSFRNRLTFFFILLVILPVLAVASVGILIVRNSEEGKNNDALEQAKRAAASLYSDAEDRARAVAQTIQTDDALAVAVRDGDREALRARLEALAERGGAQLVRLTLDGEEPVEAGRRRRGGARARPRARRGGQARRDALAVGHAGRRLRQPALARHGPGGRADPGRRGRGRHDRRRRRAGPRDAATRPRSPATATASRASRRRPSTRARRSASTCSSRDDDLQNAVSENTLGIFLILLAFLICALAFALTAARSLRLQTTRLLEAAKQIGSGDFSVEVPTEGNDEFGALGKEFNSMARQLRGAARGAAARARSGCRMPCGASASRSARAWTATRRWRSSSRRRSTASAPTAAAS